MSRRQDASPILDELSRERDHAEHHIRTHRSLGAKFIKGAEDDLVRISRQEDSLYRWIAEEETQQR